MVRKKRTMGRLGRLMVFMLVILAVGLIIFRVTVSAASENSRVPEPRYKYYTSVQIHQGDTLWSIAETYMTGEYQDIYEYIDEVMEINHMGSDYLRAGERLCVPYYSSEYKE